MKPGYSMTELGEIPESWAVELLGDIANFSQGIQVDVEKQITEPRNNYVRFIRIVDYTKNNDDIRYVENLGDRYYAKSDDIIMVRYGTPGLIGRRIEGIIANNMFKITFKKILDNNYAEQYFKFPDTLRRIKDGSGSSTMPAINFSFLKTLKIIVPPLIEQHKIAEILTTVDKKIEVIESRTSKTQELKKGLMQQLLTKGIGHTKFKDSELGEIPESWDVVNSSDVFELIHGNQFRDYDFTETGLKIIKIGQIKASGKIDISDCSYFAEERAEEFKSNKIINGDVLMALTGATLGKSCLVSGLNEPVYQNYRVGKFEPVSENVVSKMFLYFLIGSELVLDQIFAKVNSGAQGNIGKADFVKLKIRLPKVDEQKKIAEILKCIDDKLEVLQAKKENFQELKKGLMQQLLTGRTRVRIN